LSYIPKAYGISSYVDSPGPCVARISTVLCRFIADSLPTLPLIFDCNRQGPVLQGIAWEPPRVR